jgi:Flp pilus assembly protein TadD
MTTLMEMDTFESRDLFRRAEIQINRGRYREASSLLTHALKISPDNPIYVSHLGYCIGMLGNIEGGEKMCRRAAQLAPAVPIVLVNLGKILVDTGRRQEARKLFAQAYRIDNTHSPAALELSRLGVRRQPVIPFLDRGNVLNKYLGKLRHRILDIWNARNRKLC